MSLTVALARYERALTTLENLLGVEAYKFNPNHDPETGEFSEGGGSSVSLPSTESDFHKQNPHVIRYGVNPEQRASEFDALPDSAHVWVFHGATDEKADKILKHGFTIGDKPSRAADEHFGPGYGLSKNLYVATDPMNAAGYGKRILAIRVPKGKIAASPEQLRYGKHVTAGAALSRSDAIITDRIDPSQVIDVTAAGKYTRSYDALKKILTGKGKDLGDEAGAFAADLDTLVTRSYRGHIGAASFATQMDALLTQYIRASYLEGLAEGGIDESEMDAADEKAIRDMVAAQREYVDGFAAAVMEAKQEADLRAEIDARVVFWGRSIAGAAQAGLTSAKGKEVVEWQIGHTEHCHTCIVLDGQKHTRRWFAERGYNPGIPGASMDCGGFNCACELVPVAGIRSSIVSHLGTG